MILEEGQIAQMYSGLIISDLGDTSKCTIKSGNCISDHRTIIWDPKSLKRSCNYTSKGTFDGELVRNHLLVPDLTIALEVTSQLAQTCSSIEKANLTRQGLAVVLHLSLNETSLIPDSREKRSSSNQEISDQISEEIDSKLHYFVLKFRALELRNFQKLFDMICKLNQHQFRIIKTFTKIHPSLGMRLLLDKQDIHAQWSGETISIL